MGRRTIAHRQTGRIPCALATHIQCWRENLIDYDTLVDDRRAALNRAVDELRTAVRDRDRAATHLAHLIDVALAALDWLPRVERETVQAFDVTNPGLARVP